MNKRRILSNFIFVVTSLVVVLIFVSATTYIQLAIATALYLPVVYLAFKVFPRKNRRIIHPKESVIAEIQPSMKSAEKAMPARLAAERAGPQVEPETTTPKTENLKVSDIDKRVFLKLIGGTGLTFLLFSILNKKAEKLLPGIAQPEQGLTLLKDTAGNKIDPAQTHPTDGYIISEMDGGDNTFYGFINKDGAWYIMKEETTGSFRYSRGNSNFPDFWTKRNDLKYDYFDNVFRR